MRRQKKRRKGKHGGNELKNEDGKIWNKKK
jgi:hypothetical protein